MEVQVTPRRAVAKGRRAAIMTIQQRIFELPKEGVGPVQVTTDYFPLVHHFAPHSYGREIFLPADSVIVGKIHKHAHLNVLSQGRVRVFTEGQGELELIAPYTFVSTPGTKRVVHVLEDAVWTTMHVVSMADPRMEDLPEIERELIATDFPED